jgi:hypothetical protein
MDGSDMKDKYIEERFPRYFIFGHSENKVCLADSDGDVLLGLKESDANRLINDRDKLLDFMIAMAHRFNKCNPDEFEKFWYHNH